MPDAQDKTTIKVSERGQQVLSALTGPNLGMFRTELAAYLAAAAFALQQQLIPIDDSEIIGPTKWNRGSGAINEWETLAGAFLSTDEPIRMLMGYAEAGLEVLSGRVDKGRTPSEIFAEP